MANFRSKFPDESLYISIKMQILIKWNQVRYLVFRMLITQFKPLDLRLLNFRMRVYIPIKMQMGSMQMTMQIFEFGVMGEQGVESILS